MHALLKGLLLTAALAAGAALAGEAPGERATASGGRLLLAQADCPSLDDAIERIRRQYNGRIVSAETRVRGKREVHHIKLLTEDGTVKTFRIPGCSRGS